MIYYVLKILRSEHSKSERAQCAPPALDRVKKSIKVELKKLMITMLC